MKRFVFLLLVLIGLSSLDQTLFASCPAPIIKDNVPKAVAPGPGQLEVFQGFHLTGITSVTFTPETVGPPVIACTPALVAASSANEYYFSLSGCPVTAGVNYYATVTTACGTSNKTSVYVRTRPDRPVPRKLCGTFSATSYSGTSSASAGSTIGILAYGTDTTGAAAVFNVGSTEITVPASSTLVGPIGVINLFTVPGAASGITLVQLETTVGTSTSYESFSLLLTVP